MAVRKKERRREDGSTYWVYEARWKDPKTGKWPSATFERKKDAERHYEEMTARVRAGVFIRDRDTVIFAKAFDEWLNGPPDLPAGTANPYGIDLQARLRVGDIGPDTIENYESSARLYVLDEFGSTPLPEIDSAWVKRWSWRLAESQQWSYVKQHIEAVRGTLKYAVARRPQWLVRNPLQDEPIEKPQHAQGRRVKEPTLQEVYQLVSAVARGPEIGDHLFTFYTCEVLVALDLLAMRTGENCGLRWGDCNLKEGVLSINCTFTRGRLLKLPKGDRRRSFALPDGVRDVLWQHHIRCGKPADDRFVIGPDQGARPLPPNNVSTWLFPFIMRRAGLIDTTRPPNCQGHHPSLFSSHSLRRFVASLLNKNKVAMAEIQSLLGHSRPATTQQYIYWQPPIDHGAVVLQEMSDQLGVLRIAKTSAPPRQLPTQVELLPPPPPPEHKPFVRNGVIINATRPRSRDEIKTFAIEQHVQHRRSARPIGRELGVDPGTIIRLLREAGVYDPRAGHDTPARVAKRARVVQLYKDGIEIDQLCTQERVYRNDVYKWARAAGVPLRGWAFNRRPRGPNKLKGGRPRKERDPQVVARAVERYRNGDHSDLIAREAKVSPNYVYDWVRAAGVPLRGRGSQNKPKARCLELFHSGKSQEQIAELMPHIQPPTIYDWLLEANLVGPRAKKRRRRVRAADLRQVFGT